MARKSIIDIEVNDQQFKTFQAQFDKYQASLKTMPGAWAKAGKSIEGSKDAFEVLVAASIAQTLHAKQHAAAQKKADDILKTQAERWKDMAHSAKTFAGHVAGATRSLLRWAEITGLISGLVGSGGLYGIERLATASSASRYASQGLGLGTGQYRSFGVNFGRLTDPGAFLGGVSGAMGDLNQRVGLYGAGLNEGDLSAGNANVSVKLLENLKRIADQTDPRMYGQVIQARHLGQFTSIEDLRRLHAMSGEEFGGLISNYRRDISSVDIPVETQRKWQDFTTQMDRASTQIQTTFINGLVPLAPGLTHLSDSVQKAISAFLGSDTLKGWLTSLDEGIEKFASYIGTPDFDQKVRGFVDDIGALASGVHSALQWLGVISPTSPGTSFGPHATALRDGEQLPGYSSGIGGNLPSPWRPGFKNGANGSFASLGSPFASSGGEGSWAGTQSAREAYIRQRAAALGIDPDTAVRVARSEGLGAFKGDKGTSFGDFQLHYGGSGITGMNGSGLGDAFTSKTGLDARDQNNWRAADDYALSQASRGGWGPFHGAANSGIQPWQGIGTRPDKVQVEVTSQPGSNAIATVNGMAQAPQ